MSRTPVAFFLVIPGLGRLFFALEPDYTDTDDAPAAGATPVSRGSACTKWRSRRRHESSEIDVEEEDQVTLLLTRDRPIEARVHDCDLEKEVSPDEEIDLSFGADLTGRFDIGDHETDTGLATLLVQPR